MPGRGGRQHHARISGGDLGLQRSGQPAMAQRSGPRPGLFGQPGQPRLQHRGAQRPVLPALAVRQPHPRRTGRVHLERWTRVRDEPHPAQHRQAARPAWHGPGHHRLRRPRHHVVELRRHPRGGLPHGRAHEARHVRGQPRPRTTPSANAWTPPPRTSGGWRTSARR
jgi:hypothetical protein